ncbi:sulfurtransferase complex subunit TusB [Buchnera aphidicola (Ceratoglyphina bambusae)]|uniref:sulfurtransferase complex subunit TusB n=1 Tax=Buchnera aphidicola TaxID=9 RepID=UPI0031B82A44
MLHILMNSPFFIDSKMLFNFIKKKDYFIAIQDGVIISIKNNIFLNKIVNCSKNLYVLEEDLIARGLILKTSKNFSLINYSDFVDLTIKNKTQIKW